MVLADSSGDAPGTGSDGAAVEAAGAPPAPGRPGSGTSSPLSLAQIRLALESLVNSYDPACWSLADAEAQVMDFTVIERLGGIGKALAASRVATVRDRSGEGPGSTSRWLTTVTGGTPGEARSTLQLGAGLDQRPELSKAARRGALSPARASRVLDAAAVDPASEQQLVSTAVNGSHGDHRTSCAQAKARARSKEDDRARHRRQLDLRSLRSWEDDEGMCRIEAALTPEDGAEVLHRLRTSADRFFTEARREGRRDAPSAYLADALVALICGGGAGRRAGGATGAGSAGGGPTGAGPTGGGPGGSPPAGSPGGSPAGSPGSSPSGSPSGSPDGSPDDDCPGDSPAADLPDRVVCGPRATVELRLSAESLRRGSVEDGEVCELAGVGPIPLATARDLLGDSLVRLVITDGVDVVTVTSQTRTVPAAVRAALLARDHRRCVVPGCRAGLGLEIDHWQVDFANGGATELSNLALLCRTHHRLKTYRGYRLDGGPGAWRWVPPDRRGPDTGPPPGTDDDVDRGDGPGDGETPLFRME